jgi:hypothetical protein
VSGRTGIFHKFDELGKPPRLDGVYWNPRILQQGFKLEYLPFKREYLPGEIGNFVLCGFKLAQRRPLCARFSLSHAIVLRWLVVKAALGVSSTLSAVDLVWSGRSRPAGWFDYDHTVERDTSCRLLLSARRPQRRYRCARRCRFQKFRPSIHQSAALFEQITAPIGGFHFVADSMRQRHLDHFAREACSLGSPIPKRAAEAVNGC